MITYDRELHARNIAALNARNDQNDIDIRLAAGLQVTLDRVSAILQRKVDKAMLKCSPIDSNTRLVSDDPGTWANSKLTPGTPGENN